MRPLQQAFRRWAVRVDVGLGLALAIILTCIVLWELNDLLKHASGAQSDARSFFSAIAAAWAAIVLACLGGAIKITAARQSLVTLFTSEIRAIQYGLMRMEMFNFWALVHANASGGAAGFADVPREENYFALFHGVIGNVANLHPRVVEAIVRYYTYLKMSRDAAGALASWEKVTQPDLRQAHVVYVVRLLSLSSLWGFVALWYMGQMATEADWDLDASMKNAVENVVGTGAYAKLREIHPEHDALSAFFSAPPPQSGSNDQPTSGGHAASGGTPLAKEIRSQAL
jgi:hypothetical protein